MGVLTGVSCWIVLPSSLLAALALGYFAAPLWLWVLAAVVVMGGYGAKLWLIGVVVAVALPLMVPQLRRVLITPWVMRALRAVLPKISETERTAIEAGVVWAEAELFSGKPNFRRLLAEPLPQLSAEEQAFLDGPTEQLCAMVDDWQIWRTRTLPDEVLQFIKDQGFLGMIIPKSYGGLELSASAHAAVIAKLASRSITTAITVMVPNSLGPAELLTHYGTAQQKQHYLPRLAKGLELPCFALTEPTAGSDAGSITATGVLFRGDDGELYLRLNWNKRWITLAAISTVLGLAFRLRDPQRLLGGEEDLGITCALVPSQTAGVVLGRRHDPLGVPFYNCPTQGHDVVVKAEDAIIGGLDQAGGGWKMLMESLAAGRGISLPSQSLGGVKLATRVVSAHASVRKQFGLPIGRFEGVSEAIARIVEANYYLESMWRYTLGALDRGVSPPVVSAMVKYQSTECLRHVAADAMDVMGGAGISLGPRNVLAQMSISAPIAITVEGANILTRTMIVFGQGALRAHPYAYEEVVAAEQNDVVRFDRAFFGHVRHIVRNSCRALVLSLTRGVLLPRELPGKPGRYVQKLSWASASFALFADLAMGLLGAQLKVKEKLTGRMADILAWMYIGSATLARWRADGQRPEDLPLVDAALQRCMRELQHAFDGLLANFRAPGVGWLFRGPLRCWSRLNRLGSEVDDRLGQQLCELILREGEQRDRLTAGIYLPDDPAQALGRLERAFRTVKRAQGTATKVRAAIKAGTLPRAQVHELVDLAHERGVLSAEEHQLLTLASQLELDAIQVDDFDEQEYRSRT